MDSSMDYGSMGGESRLGSEDSNQLLPNKFDPSMVQHQQHMPESVAEALAGPSGMQGGLGGGDLGGFASMDGFGGGEGRGGDLRQPLPGQQPQGHQMMRLK